MYVAAVKASLVRRVRYTSADVQEIPVPMEDHVKILMLLVITNVLACQASLAEIVKLELEMVVLLDHVKMGGHATLGFTVKALLATVPLASWASTVNLQWIL